MAKGSDVFEIRRALLHAGHDRFDLIPGPHNGVLLDAFFEQDRIGVAFHHTGLEPLGGADSVRVAIGDFARDHSRACKRVFVDMGGKAERLRLRTCKLAIGINQLAQHIVYPPISGTSPHFSSIIDRRVSG